MDQNTPRGKLKIFLGYADGVGKTYAMLEDGIERKVEGVDVVAAWVETYQQSATDALVRGLESVPGKGSPTAGGNAVQMDADAVLARKPQLALVDDLAHRNAPGSRHTQRYQDVLELLQAGVSVYSTMNVQSLESLNDIVRQITGVTVEETVPDSLLDEADELELVDLPPEELLQRLRDGKTHPPLSGAYTQIGELAALRQIALRETAERVDEDMRDYMAERAIQGPWPAAVRVLVCLSSHPIGDRLVRAGRRMAEVNHAEWFVVFVETPRHLQMNLSERALLMHNLRVAEEMGAHAVILTGESVVDALLEFARWQNITHIVIGKPRRSRLLELVRGSRLDRLLEHCGNMDVFVVSEEGHPDSAGIPAAMRLHAPLSNYLFAAGLAGLAALVGLGLERWLAPANLIMIFLLSVMLSAALFRTGPAILTAVLSTGAFAWLFADELMDARHLVTLAGLLAVGLLVGTLTGWLRAQIKAARGREIQSAALNALSRDRPR